MLQSPQTDDGPSSAKKREWREAMLSVYYHCLGKQWQQQGAPAVLLPPSIRPLGLAAALDRLSESPPRLEAAIWRIIRSAPWRQTADGTADVEYPPALSEHVRSGWLEDVDALRRQYRKCANLCATALYLLADNDIQDAKRLAGIVLAQEKEQPSNEASSSIFERLSSVAGYELSAGLTQQGGFLSRVRDAFNLPKTRSSATTAQARAELAELESRVGSSARALMMNFADAFAFDDTGCPIPGARSDKSESALYIYPVSSVVVQETSTLTTRATVTAMVDGPFELIRQVVDPQSWSKSSDVMTRTDYVTNAFRPNPLNPAPQRGSGYEGSRLLHETAEISWGTSDDQQGVFDVILNTTFEVAEKEKTIDVGYTLGSGLLLAVSCGIGGQVGYASTMASFASGRSTRPGPQETAAG